MATNFKPLKTIGETIIAYRVAHPDSSCEEITTYVKKHFKGCNTNPASVACTLGKAAKKSGNMVLRPGRVDREQKDFDAPVTFDINMQENEPETPEETDEEAKARIMLRYDAMSRLGPKVIAGRVQSLIVSGPPGIGKSWTIKDSVDMSGRLRHDGLTNVGGGGPMSVKEDELEGRDILVTNGWYDWISGGCTSVGLYHALWNMRKGGLIVFDDCDSIFRDEDSINLLKIATDSTKERMISWRKNASWLDEYEIDKTFDFKGHIIFLTNIDFEQTILRDNKMSDHYKAFIDRAAYLCLTLRSARDFMIVLDWKAVGTKKEPGFLFKEPYKLKPEQAKELMDFIRDNQSRFYNLSLRLVGQLAIQMTEDTDNWRKDASATKMRTL